MEKGVPIETEKTIEQNYNNATKSATLLQNIVSIMILVIGIVNFANVIIISVTSRKKRICYDAKYWNDQETAKVVANDGRYKYFNYNANNLVLFEFSYHLCRCECLFTNAMDCDISFFYYATFSCNAGVNYFADSDILNLLSTYTED